MENEVFKASVLVSSLFPKEKVDAAFFHGRAVWNKQGLGEDVSGLFGLVSGLYHKKVVDYIAVTNTEGQGVDTSESQSAWPGKTVYINRLMLLGVPDNRIVLTNMPALHTRQENDAFLDLAKSRLWESGIIVAHPHQLLRSILGMVQSMDQQRYWIKVYTAAPLFTNWREPVNGNQGQELKPRMMHIENEIERILKYQNLGLLASFEQFLDYAKNL
ncbi:hypothetical protein HYW46_06915 [Candidatus Daviesbacteria bacterium]|nr:hypothetical protein [Candidatus Daviesbacteria bacterium]